MKCLKTVATISLGYVGVYETCIAFFGQIGKESEAHQFAEAVVKRMHDYCQEWAAESGAHYSLYSTPAESLTDTFAILTKKNWGCS